MNDRVANSFLASTLLEGLGNPTILCILGSRIFFNLKEAAELGVNIGTNWSSYSHSAIHFEEGRNASEQYVAKSPLRKLVLTHDRIDIHRLSGDGDGDGDGRAESNAA